MLIQKFFILMYLQNNQKVIPAEVWNALKDKAIETYVHFKNYVAMLKRERLIEKKGAYLVLTENGQQVVNQYSKVFDQIRQRKQGPIIQRQEIKKKIEKVEKEEDEQEEDEQEEENEEEQEEEQEDLKEEILELIKTLPKKPFHKAIAEKLLKNQDKAHEILLTLYDDSITERQKKKIDEIADEIEELFV